MAPVKQRRSLEDGHTRKFLVVVDESAEVDAALFFAASRCQHTSGSLLLLYVIEPQDFQHWMGVRQVQLDEETTKARALFRLMRRKLANAGIDDVEIEETIREGAMADQIRAQIEEDEDVAVFVLGAAVGSKGPGPLVSSLAAGNAAGTFPIPITIVPGDLSLEELRRMA